MREQNAVLGGEAEHSDRQASNCAGQAVAIEIEGGKIGRADFLRHVHFHAVNDSQKILALQVELPDGSNIVSQSRRRIAAVERVDVIAPLLQRRQPLRARAG